jgi:hypothetical protein
MNGNRQGDPAGSDPRPFHPSSFIHHPSWSLTGS